MKSNLFLQLSIMGLMLASCNLFQKSKEKTILIGSFTQPCVAGTMETECIQIKWTKDQAEWQNFYGEIEGFTFERGNEYELIVNEEEVKNPPADASSFIYKLVKEVSKTKVDSQPINYGDNSRNALDWEGTYDGILPCADCEGIKTSITLLKDGTFTRTIAYLGKNAMPFSDNGKIEWNSEGSAITLINDNTDQKYQVGENQLFHLDQAGNQIKGALSENYILRKIPIETTSDSPAFEDKKWMLVNFMGNVVEENEAEYYIIFNSKEKRLNTKVGCNTMNANYELSNELSMKIKPLMSTMMACPENSIEDAYTNYLVTVDNITTNGELLHLNKARMTIATYKFVK